MIVLSDVSKSYFTKAGEVKALQNVSLTLPERGLVFLVGRSGSGKTTLLDLLGGLSEPTEGSISFGEKRPVCGYVFQDIGLYPYLTAEENVCFAGVPKERAAELLRAVGMEEYAARRTRTLSGGEQQRVAVARMLALEPELILADEPTGALDEENAEGIFSLLKELAKERLVLVVTHDEESAQAFGDVLYKIDGGKVSPVFDRLAPENAGERSKGPASRVAKERPMQASPADAEERPMQASPAGARAGRKEKFALAAKFSFRRMAAAKFRNALFVLLLFLLLSVLFVGVSVLTVDEALVIRRHLQSHGIEYFSVRTSDTFNYLSRFERAALEENAEIVYIAKWRKDSGVKAGISEHLSEFVPLVKGSYEGAVVLSGSPEEVEPGYTVQWGGLVLTVTGIADKDALPEPLQRELPNILFGTQHYSYENIQFDCALQAVVKLDSLTSSEFYYLLRDCKLEAFGFDWEVIVEEDGLSEYEAGAYIYNNAFFIIRSLKTIFTGVGGGLLLAAVLYAVWFMGDAVRSDRRAVGIMKSLGKSEREITGIYLLQAVMLFIAAVLLSAAGTGISLYLLNDILSFSIGFDILFFLPEVWYLLMFVGVSAVLFCAVLLPLRAIKKVQIGILLRSL